MELLFREVLLLAHVWGWIVAILMRRWSVGRFMAEHMVWFIVSLSLGVCCLLLWTQADAGGAIVWTQMVAVFFVTSLPIAGWSISDLAQQIQDWIGLQLGRE